MSSAGMTNPTTVNFTVIKWANFDKRSIFLSILWYINREAGLADPDFSGNHV